MSLTSFYEASAMLCFALLGFWWIVIQLRHEEWTTSPRMRAIAFSVSLSFVFPGIMSLAALLAVENNALWRIGFGVAGVLGGAQTLFTITSRRLDEGAGGTLRVGRLAMLALYVLIVAVAARPTLPKDLGLNVKGIVIEGAIVATFIFLGVLMAFSYFMRPSDQPLE